MNLNSPKLSLIVPVRNEGVNLKIMLKVLGATVDCPFEVLVIYDFDEDDSVPVVQQLKGKFPFVHAIKNHYGPGVIQALRCGFEKAKGEYVLIFAADEVGPVIAIEDMMTLLEEGCDLVSCTRYAHGGRRLGGSFIGGILSKLANRLFRLAIPNSLSDCTTGIKMFKKGVFESLGLVPEARGWSVAFEMTVKAQAKGLQLGEVPIVSIDRLYGGRSTFRLGSSINNYMRWFVWGLTHNLTGPKTLAKPLRVKSSTYFNGKHPNKSKTLDGLPLYPTPETAPKSTGP